MSGEEKGDTVSSTIEIPRSGKGLLHCNSEESSISVVYSCVTKLSARLGHDNMIPAKGGHQGGDILSYRASGGERKEPHSEWFNKAA